MFKYIAMFSLALVMNINFLYCMNPKSFFGPHDFDYYDHIEKHIEQTFIAISEGDIKTLELALNKGLLFSNEGWPLIVRNADNETLLAYAIKKKQEAAIKLLLEKGADVNEKSGNCPPLIEAIRAGVPSSILNMLLNHKDIDINAQASDSGATALHQTVVCQKNNLIPVLIERGANINAKDNEGGTPLDWAHFYAKPNVEAAKILGEHGAQENPTYTPKKIIVKSASIDDISLDDYSDSEDLYYEISFDVDLITHYKGTC